MVRVLVDVQRPILYTSLLAVWCVLMSKFDITFAFKKYAQSFYKRCVTFSLYFDDNELSIDRVIRIRVNPMSMDTVAIIF